MGFQTRLKETLEKAGFPFLSVEHLAESIGKLEATGDAFSDTLFPLTRPGGWDDPRDNVTTEELQQVIKELVDIRGQINDHITVIQSHLGGMIRTQGGADGLAGLPGVPGQAGRGDAADAGPAE